MSKRELEELKIGRFKPDEYLRWETGGRLTALIQPEKSIRVYVDVQKFKTMAIDYSDDELYVLPTDFKRLSDWWSWRDERFLTIESVGSIFNAAYVEATDKFVLLFYSHQSGKLDSIRIGYGCSAEAVEDRLMREFTAGNLDYMLITFGEAKKWKVYEFHRKAIELLDEIVKFERKDFLEGLMKFFEFIEIADT